MQYFAQFCLNGLALGSVYALLAVGYTIVYGIVKLINFAHGEFYMLGAFVGLACAMVFETNVGLAMLAGMVVGGIVAALTYSVAYRPLMRSGRLNALVAALAISLLLQNAGVALFGAEPRVFPQVIPLKTFHLGPNVVVSNYQIMILASALILMTAISLFLRLTTTGWAVMAVSMDHEAASLVGISVNRMVMGAFLVGGLLAGQAGVLVGMYYGSCDPLMGLSAGLKAFAAAVLGGIGSVTGALIGGLLIGLAESALIGMGAGGMKDGLAFLVLVIVLTLRPQGLLGGGARANV